jgi:tetratricopeptide (TPR) repeat protein
MQRENFFLLLELDDTVDDWTVIEAHVLERKRVWSKDRSQGNPKARRRAERGLGLLAEIETVLKDPESRRQEAREARKLRQQEQQTKLKELDGSCDELTVKTLEKQFAGVFSAAEIAQRLRAAGIEIRGAEAPVERPIKDQIDKVTAGNIRRNLDHLGVADLYAFLELVPHSSCRALTDRAEEIYKENQRLGRKDADAAAGNELAGFCKTLFQGEREKARYDSYLVVEAMEGLRNNLDLAGSDNFINRHELEELVKQARQRGVPAEDARAYVEGYAAKRKWGVDRDATPIKELRQCGYCLAFSPPEAATCGLCGEPLEIACPRCGARNLTQNAACTSCGCHIGDAPLVKGLYKEGQRHALDGRIEEALHAFDKALLYWPDWPPAVSARAEVRQRQETRETDLRALEILLRERRLTAALAALDRFGRQHGGTSPERWTQQIRDGIATAEAAFRRGESLRREGRLEIALDAWDEAITACADFAPALQAMAASPPPPPSALAVEPLAAGFRLRWRPAGSRRSVTYRVRRKTGGMPQASDDGELVGEVATESIDDVTVPVGQAVFYSVFTLRGGASPAGAASGPHLRTAEVADLAAMAGDREVTLSWTPPPGFRRVAVFRAAQDAPQAGAGTTLTTAGTSAHDSGLENGVRYGYRVVALFADPARPDGEVASAGTVVFATPVAPPPPVTDLRAARDGRSVMLSWTPIPGVQVQVRQNAKQPACAPGHIFAVSQLDRFGHPIASASPGSAQVTLETQGQVFFVPFSVTSSTAVAGRAVEVVHLDSVNDLVARRAGGGILLTWSWPAGVDEAAVCYAHDRYPEDPLRPEQGVATTVTRREYERDGGWLLRRAERAPHYFSVFARAGDDLYAPPARTLESLGQGLSVAYRVVVTKRLLRRAVEDARIELTCRETGNGFALPALLVVGKPRQVPLSPRDGELLTEVPEVRFENGRAAIPIPEKHWRGQSYVKLFFKDAAKAREVRLLPAEKERLRIG